MDTNVILKKTAMIVIVVLIAVISFTKVSVWAGNPDSHKHTIEQTDDKIKTVMALSAGAAGTSATLSLLPGDLCTPLSEQLADLAKYFLIILSALYLEKFLITLSGYISFRFLVPLACLIVCVAIIIGKRSLYSVAAKIALIGAVLFLIVPGSVLISDKIYQTQAEKVENTINEYNNLDLDESGQGILSELATITTNTIDNVTSFISSLLESLAVMIVTACIVPVLVFVFLVWIVKAMFSGNTLSIDTDTISKLAEKLHQNQA